MGKWTVTMQSGGRLQLPEELCLELGWAEKQWYEIQRTPEGVVVRQTTAPAAPDAIHRIFAESFSPLGFGRGEGHNQYVSRWKHRSGVVIVSENGQPNIWLSKAVVAAFKRSVSGEVKYFEPGTTVPGFHSNVASTAGLKGLDLVKIRAGDAAEAEMIATEIVAQLEALP